MRSSARLATTTFLLLGFWQPVASIARPTVLPGESTVKEQPLLERPNRIGHFYGNSVRRLHHGRWCVNCGEYQRPVARFFYRPE